MASFDGKTYTHDILGRLTDVELSPGGDTVQMAYDGLGRRISRTNASGTESYLWAGGQVFEITTAAGQRRNVVQGAGLDDVVCILEPGGGVRT